MVIVVILLHQLISATQWIAFMAVERVWTHCRNGTLPEWSINLFKQGESPPSTARGVSPPFAFLSFRFHVLEILVHNLKANRFIESFRRRIRNAGGDAHTVHPARLHPA